MFGTGLAQAVSALANTENETMLTARFSAPLLLLLALGFAGCGLETGGPNSSSAVVEGGRPYFELSRVSSSHYFHFVGADGETLLASQAYSSRTVALNGVLSVIDHGPHAGFYQVVDNADGSAYFVLRAVNGAIIGESEGYASHEDAAAGVEASIEAANDYQDWLANRTGRRFDVFRGADGRWYFNLHAGNGEIVLRSQGYQLEESAWNGCASVIDHGTSAARYDVRQAANGQWYFNLTAANGQVIGTSELYVSRYNAERARDGVSALLPTVDLL
jgi:uncharacterized protein YegP (UPF0339 family)